MFILFDINIFFNLFIFIILETVKLLQSSQFLKKNKLIKILFLFLLLVHESVYSQSFLLDSLSIDSDLNGAIECVDMDNDGDLDIVFAGRLSGTAPKEIKFSDFEKVKMTVKNGKVYFGKKKVKTDKEDIIVDIDEGIVG